MLCISLLEVGKKGKIHAIWVELLGLVTTRKTKGFAAAVQL